MHTCNEHTHATLPNVVLTRRPSISSLSAIIIHLKPPPLVLTAHLPPSITLHLAERETTWIAFLWESPQPSHQLPGSRGSREENVGKSKETTTHCQPCPHYSERNCSKAGVGEQHFIWIVKICLPQKVSGIKKCISEIRWTQRHTYNLKHYAAFNKIHQHQRLHLTFHPVKDSST